MKKIFMAALLVLGILIIGCPAKKVVQPEQQPGVTPQETKKGISEDQPTELITEQKLAKIDTVDEPSKYIEERGLFKDIHFDFDKYDIRPDAEPILQSVSTWLMKNSANKILIEGHCDERGTNEYNLALGDRRTKATRDYLTALGVASNRIEMISYGEEKPFCSDKTEECWQKNRRAQFVILKEAGK